MWADVNCELIEQFQVLKKLTIDTWEGLVCFLFAYTLQLFAYSMRIFELKKKFLTWSMDFIQTIMKKCSLKLPFIRFCVISKSMDHVRHD